MISVPPQGVALRYGVPYREAAPHPDSRQLFGLPSQVVQVEPADLLARVHLASWSCCSAPVSISSQHALVSATEERPLLQIA